MPFSLLRGDWWCWMCHDSSMQQVWVWLWVSITMAFDRFTEWFEENTCSARAEDPRSPFFTEPGGVHEDDAPRTYLFGQCSIQHMGCCTPHLSCNCLVLGPWGAQAPGRKVTWMASGAKTLRMDSDSPLIHGSPGRVESADQAVGRCACV